MTAAPLLLGERRRKRLARALERHAAAHWREHGLARRETGKRLAVIALGREAGLTAREAIRAWGVVEIPAEAHCRLLIALTLDPATLAPLSERRGVLWPSFSIDWWRLGCFASLATAGVTVTVEAVLAALAARSAAPMPCPPQRLIAEASGASLRAVNAVLAGRKVGVDNFMRLFMHAGMPLSVLDRRDPRFTTNTRCNTLNSQEAA